MNFCQGDIVIVDFTPTLGHEQMGKRPAVIISKDKYNNITKQIIVCPITTKTKNLPMRIKLDERIQTQGFVMCDQVRTLDIKARNPVFAEKIPKDILDTIKRSVSAVIL